MSYSAIGRHACHQSVKLRLLPVKKITISYYPCDPDHQGYVVLESSATEKESKMLGHKNETEFNSTVSHKSPGVYLEIFMLTDTQSKFL